MQNEFHAWKGCAFSSCHVARVVLTSQRRWSNHCTSGRPPVAYVLTPRLGRSRHKATYGSWLGRKVPQGGRRLHRMCTRAPSSAEACAAPLLLAGAPCAHSDPAASANSDLQTSTVDICNQLAAATGWAVHDRHHLSAWFQLGCRVIACATSPRRLRQNRQPGISENETPAFCG